MDCIYAKLHTLNILDEAAIVTALFKKAFNLDNDTAYQQWRKQKMSLRQCDVAKSIVMINDPFKLQAAEKQALLVSCTDYNMALYQLKEPSKQCKAMVASLGKQLGLSRLDGNLRSDSDNISRLQVSKQAGNQYIPYTNKALSWHTDGYYNKPDRQINGFLLHCVSDAAEGGVNYLLDHEWLYKRLRDENPNYIDALMHPQAMTIPDNVESGKVIRAAQSGPVFSLHEGSGRLHMRYSARKRNIVWRDDDNTKAAVSRMSEILSDQSLVLSLAMKPGQGLICNNVLHNRTGFTDSDSKKRLMYRARYFDRTESMS